MTDKRIEHIREQWQDDKLAKAIKSAAQDSLRAELIAMGMPNTEVSGLVVQVKKQEVATTEDGRTEPLWIMRIGFDKPLLGKMPDLRFVQALCRKIYPITLDTCVVRGHDKNTDPTLDFHATGINKPLLRSGHYYRPAIEPPSRTGVRTGDFREDNDVLSLPDRNYALTAATAEELVAGLNTVLDPKNQLDMEKITVASKGTGVIRE